MRGGVRTLGVADRKPLAAAARLVCASRCCLARRLGTQCTCFTSTKVQILTPNLRRRLGTQLLAVLVQKYLLYQDESGVMLRRAACAARCDLLALLSLLALLVQNYKY